MTTKLAEWVSGHRQPTKIELSGRLRRKPFQRRRNCSSGTGLGRSPSAPKEVEHWSMTTQREKLIKIGAKIVRHGRYVTFQMAEVAVPRELFRKILSLIDDLRRRPAPA